jgi:hypothetical protein
MKYKKLDQVWDALFGAKCPMDFFGEVSDVDDLKRKIEETKSVWSGMQPGPQDGNLEYRLSRISTYFDLFSKWALETLEQGTYTQKLPYRLKLLLTIKKVEGKNYFFVENTDVLAVFFATLDAASFEGYDTRDRFRILRGSEKILEGYVSYEGTHAACERFIVGGQIVPDLEASLYMEGDRVEVETVKYSSPTQFALRVIQTSNLATSLRTAFEEHGGELNKKEFVKAVVKGCVETGKKVRETKTFVLG